MVLVNFWRYPDPYQRFLIRIRNADKNNGNSNRLQRMRCLKFYLKNSNSGEPIAMGS